MVDAVELVGSASCVFTDAEKRAYVQLRIDALPAVSKDDSVGLRIDLELEDPATGETSRYNCSSYCPRVIVNVSLNLLWLAMFQPQLQQR